MSKHIVLVTPGFPRDDEHSFIIPALQIFVKKLIEINPDFKIKIITFQYPFTSEKYKWHGADVIPLDGRNRRVNKIFVWFKAYRALKKIHQESKIDIVHSFWLRECSFVGGAFAKKNNIKHLITAMGQDVLPKNRYNKFFVKNASIITLSVFQSNFLKDNYRLQSTIIPWGINKDEFPKIESRPIDILGVGSLNEVKNYKLFINMISQLRNEGLNINVEILGDGTLKDQVVKQIEQLKLKDVIKLCGQLSRSEVLIKMAKSKVLLHTSTFESFGMVFIEALFSGMNVVSKEVGIAKQSSSWFVCKDETEMKKALVEALNTENNRELNYDVIDTVKSYKKIYNDLLEQ